MDFSIRVQSTTFITHVSNQGDQDKVLPFPANVIDSAKYVYTLDLDSHGNITGGDWLTLDRPDVLWIMEKRGFEANYTRLSEIYTPAKL